MNSGVAGVRQGLSIVLAVFAAPVFPALAIALMFYGELRLANLSFFILTYPLVLAVTLLLGLPTFALGLWLNLVRWWTAIIAGFLVGLFVVVVVGNGWGDVEALELYGGSGAVAGFVFWLVWWLGQRDQA